jgi:acyl carrier protein
MVGLVQSTLGLAARPHLREGPQQIPAWDSLGSLRLLLAIEETLGVTLNEDEVRAANTIAALSDIVAANRNGSARAALDIAALVQSVLGLAERPHRSQGPAEISAWDSLGTLRLLLAIEETYGITLNHEEISAASTVAALSDIVAAKLNGAARARVKFAAAARGTS